MLVKKFKNLKILSLLIIPYQTNECALNTSKVLVTGCSVIGGCVIINKSDKIKEKFKKTENPEKEKNLKEENTESFEKNFKLTLDEFEKDFKRINAQKSIHLDTKENKQLKHITLEKLETLSKDNNNNKILIDKIKKEIDAYLFFYSNEYEKIIDLVDFQNAEDVIKNNIYNEEIVKLKDEEIAKIIKNIENKLDIACKKFIDSRIYNIIKQKNSTAIKEYGESILDYIINSSL